MPQFPRLSWSALSAWMAAAVVAAFPNLKLWYERFKPEEFVQAHGVPETIYGFVGLYSSGSTLSPFVPLQVDLEVVMEITGDWAVPALVVLLGLLACLGRRDPRVTGRRVAGLLVLIAVIALLVRSYSGREIYAEMFPPFNADGFGAVAGGWAVTQLCLLVAAALVFAASREMRPVTGDEPAGSRAGMVWRRPVAALADYLIVVTVLGVIVGPVWSLIGIGTEYPMAFGFLERIDVLQSSPEPVELVILSVLFLYFWVQHALWGRTLGKRLLGIRVIAANTGGRLGAGRTALRALVFPLLAFVPEVGLLCLLAGGLWMLLDPEGRVLHDRWLGAAVVRDRVRDAQPQT
ncbi:RDD family protein [Streptosporangium lutulentum]|uniref:RDD family membrane protein YckC n=1 Tax=Streptosporangium lutulentum TaxID=1461250 RepID=A0ABT9QMK0_9ACTN|nr:RDD family protein [Streptosporangium lutulentum]MDP9847626.1 putative RDD family membrane protein YckC [Streptosporangium lutulentum]